MCGKCIEGCYLAGWRNGVYSFEYMQEEPDFMGKDVMAAHGLVEVVDSPDSSINDLHALGLSTSPMMAWAAWVYANDATHSSIDLGKYDGYLESQRTRRNSKESDWAEINNTYPNIANYLDNLALDHIGNHSSEALLDEIEDCLITIHGNGYYTFEFVESMFATEGLFPIIELSELAKPSLFVDHALEIFLLTEHLLHYRPLSWALQIALTVDLTCEFDSCHMAWRRYTANRLLNSFSAAQNTEGVLALASELELNTLHAVCQRSVANKWLLTLLLNVVNNCKGDTYIEPKRLAKQITSLLAG